MLAFTAIAPTRVGIFTVGLPSLTSVRPHALFGTHLTSIRSDNWPICDNAINSAEDSCVLHCGHGISIVFRVDWPDMDILVFDISPQMDGGAAEVA